MKKKLIGQEEFENRAGVRQTQHLVQPYNANMKPTAANDEFVSQGWVSGSRKSVSDEACQKPARKGGIYHFPAPEMPEMPEMPETSDQKMFFS